MVCGRSFDVDSTQNIISFCTGYGGIELGLRRAGVDVRTVVNVEIEAFCCANLVAKIEEGLMDDAVIYSDLKTFPAEKSFSRKKYTASLEDIPVSRSVARESEKERKTQDTCGHTSEAMSGQLDLFGAFSRMSEVTPRWGYGESCPIWKKMVTERSGDCTQRRKQARLTNASDASSWPNARPRTLRDIQDELEDKERRNGRRCARVI